jgi:membrane fusion protein (multidrug efflux system)
MAPPSQNGDSAGRGGREARVPAGKRGRPSLRRLWRPGVAAAVVMLLAAGVAYWRANVGLVKTDNAETGGDLAPISAQITGRVVAVLVDENQYVRAGSVLVRLDPTDERLAVANAEAALRSAQAQAQAAAAALAAQEQSVAAGVQAARGALAATEPSVAQAQAQLLMDEQTTAAGIVQAERQVTTAQANARAAQTTLSTAGRTLERDRALLAQGAIAQQQMDADTAAYQDAVARAAAAQDAVRQAQAQLASAEAARQQVAIARSAVAANQGQVAHAEAAVQQAQAGAAVTRQRAQELAAAQAQVAQAEQALRTADVNLSRTEIRAPVDGWVTNRTVEPGQIVQPNQPLMSLAIRGRSWVVANIKETQLGGVRVGDPVRITIDEYRGRVFHGHVASLGQASGSAVALLPPDNATGNFIKVVQLVPVRIAFDATPGIGQIPVGLSAEVTIDTRHHAR